MNNANLKTVVLHLGRALCGHDGIVHGGLLATVFDETLARNVSMKGLHLSSTVLTQYRRS